MNSVSISLGAIRGVVNASLQASTVKTFGTSMIKASGSAFNLQEGTLHGYQGARAQVVGETMQVVYDAKGYSGVVHEYDGTPENGKPIDLSKYSKLIIDVKDGNAARIKFQLNGRSIRDFGSLKKGKNVIDLESLKEDDFKAIKELIKIEFVNKPGRGKYKLQLFIM